ncbi:MAG: DUF2973 domain-containing protein [Oscillatoriales cyanobacterium RM2_1_1]|nr:DUF2973 domain-containing protein [Oscillatoriales cyanobacterium SM2_3_0]NJO47433.1 DUF2973 domain-containing protein [Oscillatoriales cyanobacterium RM2_1_1]
MLHLIYILAFTILAFLAVRNLILSLITVGKDSSRFSARDGYWGSGSRLSKVVHPELLDDAGHPIQEPLLVMRSFSANDVREQLDSLYNSSPSVGGEKEE